MADEITGGSGTPDAAAQAAAATAAAAAAAAKQPKTFTQEQLDTIIQERLSKPKQQLADAQKLVDEFKNNKNLTEEQQTRLQEQVNSMTKQLLTKEELSAKEKKELTDQAAARLKETTDQVNRWKGLYESSTIERDIVDGAVANDGFNPNHFIALLKPLTKLVDEMVNGKATGKSIPITSFEGRDKDGKPIQMELSPKDTIKEMKKMTDVYGNFFKSGLNSGVGGTNAGGTVGEITDDSVKSHEDWMKKRDEIKKKF